MSTQELYEKYLITTMVPGFEPIEVERASGTAVYGRDGQQYLDCFSGIAVTNAGHGHPRVIAAAKKQRYSTGSRLCTNRCGHRRMGRCITRSGLPDAARQRSR